MRLEIGIVRNGKIEIQAPSNLAEGSLVRIWLEPNEQHGDDGPMDEVEIKRRVAAMDRFAEEFPPEEDGEDLSKVAHQCAEAEIRDALDDMQSGDLGVDLKVFDADFRVRHKLD